MRILHKKAALSSFYEYIQEEIQIHFAHKMSPETCQSFLLCAISVSFSGSSLTTQSSIYLPVTPCRSLLNAAYKTANKKSSAPANKTAEYKRFKVKRNCYLSEQLFPAT